MLVIAFHVPPASVDKKTLPPWSDEASPEELVETVHPDTRITMTNNKIIGLIFFKDI